MNNFLYKEFKLGLDVPNYIYMCMACMTIIPGYPRYVPFFFFCISTFQIFQNALLNKDTEFCMILPITKKDMVKSRCILVAAYQIICILLTIPFSVAFNFIMPSGNVAGIEGNAAFYGIVLIMMFIFNFIFFITYYKKAQKPALSLIFASIVYWILFFIVEFPIWTKDIFNIQFFQMLDKSDMKSQIRQLPILFVGIVIYFIGWVLIQKIASRSFEKVDL